MADIKKPLPLWAANGFVFLFLFLAVIAYFFWQSHVFKQAFLDHAEQHAAIISEVIRLNAKGALASQHAIEEILQNLLENTARFVSYLDGIEPFNEEELTAFTRESGLAGISIIRKDQTMVHGPGNWKQNLSSFACPSNPVMEHLSKENLYLLAWPETAAFKCMALGINDKEIASIKDRMGLENTIRTISKVPGINYIKIIRSGKEETDSSRSFPIIIHQNGMDVAEAHQFIGGVELKVGVNAGHLAHLRKQLWIHLSLFSFCLVFAGVCLSIILHRYQTSILNNVKRFERELSSQREEAALGRSAAAIAHEIRNPLNALSIGLQRLEMEEACGGEEHRKLIEQMRNAVQRVNGSVTGLLNYARPRMPEIKEVSIASLTMDLLSLYRQPCENLQIRITTDFTYRGMIACDPVLMGQVIENIIKNAIEAQPLGGFIHCEIKQGEKEVALLFKNSGCTISPEESRRILEPYFTTRTEGTGLGMAIANTIIKALKGRIDIMIPGNGIIETHIHLPLSGSK
jgi:two-component system, NtrC family, sensor histidine kinase HydH